MLLLLRQTWVNRCGTHIARIMVSEVARSYRQLYRLSLRAIRYSTPARYTVRDVLRRSFREGSSADFNQPKIDNTVDFLKAAVKEAGLEHRVLKNLLMIWYFNRFNTISAATEK